MTEIVIAAIQYSSWPIMVLIGVFIFRNPVKRLLTGMRLLKAGSIEVAFDERLKKQRLSDLELEALRDLTHEEISFFLMVGYSDDPDFKYEPGLNPNNFLKKLESLEAAGLIVITNPENPLPNRQHKLTKAGKRIREIVIDSTSRLFQEHA